MNGCTSRFWCKALDRRWHPADDSPVTTPRSQGGWELTAPESLVLRDGPGADRAMALKLGLLELVARGSLRLVDVEGRNWIGRARVDKVLVSGHRPVPGTGPLAPIGAAYHNTPSRQFPDGTTGRPVAAVAQTLARSRAHRRQTLRPRHCPSRARHPRPVRPAARSDSRPDPSDPLVPHVGR